MVSGTEFVDTSSHHSAFDERSVVHPLALQKGGPCRRETEKVIGVMLLSAHFSLEIDQSQPEPPRLRQTFVLRFWGSVMVAAM